MPDEAKEECGIVAVMDLGIDAATGDTCDEPANATALVPDLLLDMQNRGQLAAGLTSYDPRRPYLLKTHKNRGSVAEVFYLGERERARRLQAELAGVAAIGHTRYATCGKDSPEYAQPLERVHGRTFKWFSFCFNGNVANHAELAKHLTSELGYHLLRPDQDTELFMHFLAAQQRGETARPWPEVMSFLAQTIDGAWSMALITAAGDLVVARDPTGLKPLCWGRWGRYFVAASESTALQNLGIHDIQAVPPGGMVQVRTGHIASCSFAPARPRHCFFEWVYFANVASVIDGASVYKARTAMGRRLAEIEDVPLGPDACVVPVPDTSKAAGDAFAYVLGIPSMEGLVRNRYIGRTFIESTDRALLVRRKFTALRGVLEGKRVFLVDDSIVRSTTLAYLIDYIRKEGRVAELHVRIACPPIVGPCFYGIDMSTVTELFAPRFLDQPVLQGILPLAIRQRMAAAIGADSLQYLPVDRIPDCIGLPENHLCTACISRKYPTPAGAALFAQALANNRSGRLCRVTTDF